jgi:hypothetical protein
LKPCRIAPKRAQVGSRLGFKDKDSHLDADVVVVVKGIV